MSKPHWAYSPGISIGAQEDEARERDAEQAADRRFVEDELAILATMRTAIKARKGEPRAYTLKWVEREVERVIARPEGQFYPWVCFVEDYGPEALRKVFRKAVAAPRQVVSDVVFHE